MKINSSSTNARPPGTRWVKVVEIHAVAKMCFDGNRTVARDWAKALLAFPLAPWSPGSKPLPRLALLYLSGDSRPLVTTQIILECLRVGRPTGISVIYPERLAHRISSTTPAILSAITQCPILSYSPSQRAKQPGGIDVTIGRGVKERRGARKVGEGEVKVKWE